MDKNLGKGITFPDSQKNKLDPENKSGMMKDLDSNPFGFNSNGLSKFKVLKSPKMLGILVELGKVRKGFMGKV